MKNKFWLIALIITLNTLLFVNLTAHASEFPDVSIYHEYANEIEYVKDNGIVNGFSDGTFRPEELVTRAELTKMVINTKFTDTEIEECNIGVFPDVATDSKFLNYICIAKFEEIISGYSDGTYRPENKVTFGEATKIIMRTLDDNNGINIDADLENYVFRLGGKNVQPPTISEGDTETNVNRAEVAFIIQVINDNYVLLPPEPRTPSSIDDDAVLGNKSTAKVAIVEFGDYQCPFCKKFHLETFPRIKTNFLDNGKAIFVYRDLPLESIHPYAKTQAIAAECAGNQNKYYEMHDKIFTGGGNFDIAELKSLATSIGLNSSTFNNCLDRRSTEYEVNRDISDAKEVGANGTPSFIIGKLNSDGTVDGELFSGAQPYSEFEKIINSYL